MKNVKVIDVPVRYNDKTYRVGESFEMENEHVNESLVEVLSDVKPKTIDEMTVPELKKYAKENDIDLGDFTKKDDIVLVIKGDSGGDE